MDSDSGKVLEERSVGPADRGGASPVIDVAVSSDGQGLAFTYVRRLGTLYLVRGLGQARPELTPERRQ